MRSFDLKDSELVYKTEERVRTVLCCSVLCWNVLCWVMLCYASACELLHVCVLQILGTVPLDSSHVVESVCSSYESTTTGGHYAFVLQQLQTEFVTLKDTGELLDTPLVVPVQRSG